MYMFELEPPADDSKPSYKCTLIPVSDQRPLAISRSGSRHLCSQTGLSTRVATAECDLDGSRRLTFLISTAWQL